MAQIDRVDPELLPQLLALSELDPPITRGTLQQVRDRSKQRIAEAPIYGTATPRKETITTSDGYVDLYIFENADNPQPKPCLVWLHGGGYIMGYGKDMWFGPLFAERTGCTVVSVDYRLAPEHPFPAGLNDAYTALKWVHDKAGALGIDPDRIAIGGASAGAGLAAGLALFNRDQHGPALRQQLLLYPMLDNLHNTLSGEISDHPVWCRSDSLAAWEMYLNGDLGPQASAYAAPSRAVDLANLPPAFLSVGEVDLFLDEGVDYAMRIEQSGGLCNLHTYPGVFHAAEAAGAETKIGRKMINEYVAALQACFN